MPLDRIITDPIISTENATFTPSPSRFSIDSEHLPLPPPVVVPSERDPLVGGPKGKKPFYRARPLWLVPFALAASLTRGMTLASRVEVFTELSCRQLHHNHDHTSTADMLATGAFVHSQIDTGPSFVPSYLSLPRPAQDLGESEGDGVNEGDDPRVVPGRRCVSDPAVQAGAARLQAIMTTTMGALSALTTGWWGHFGERHGRTRVLAISTLGLLLTDLIFILVSTPRNPLAAHSHKLLILAPIIEGLLGGWSSLTGAHTAYIADCTSLGSRATIFARFTGVLFVGLALGPLVGAWLIRNPIPFLRVEQVDHPLQSVNSVFWVAICGSFVNLLLVLFVFPESLPISRREVNGKGKNRPIGRDDFGVVSTGKHNWAVTGVVKSFISPLAQFLPADVPTVRTAGMLNRPGIRRDWSLTFLALSLFVHTLSSGLLQLKYLYAEHVYDWAAEQLNYYISFMGAVRAFHLLVLLPLLLIAFKPIRAVVSSAVPAQFNTNDSKAKPKLTKYHLFSEIRFDLHVVRYSMFIDFCSHALVVLSPPFSNDPASASWSQLMFVGATSLACAGAGVIPAAQSLALCTLQGRKMAEEEIARLQGGADNVPVEQDVAAESGKLFSAVSVIQTVGSTIVGPVLFGVIYGGTVGLCPKAIFAAAGVLVMAAFILTGYVRPDASLSVLRYPRRKRKFTPMPRHIAEERRGRSRVKKDLRGGSASFASYDAMRCDLSASSAETEADSVEHA